MTTLDKSSIFVFFDDMEKAITKLAKKNSNIETRILFAELMDMFLHIIFGFFEKNNAQQQFVPSVMSSLSNYVADRVPNLARENENV